MLRRTVLIATIACLTVLITPHVASAHVLKVDGDIGAVLHIYPDDAPTTKVPTNYEMKFNSDGGKFSLPKCNCNVTYILNGETIDTQPLVASDKYASVNKYTFQTPGVYTFSFTGSPKIPGDFAPFQLDYDVRVTGNTSKPNAIPLTLWIGMSLVAGLVLLIAIAVDSK